MQTTRPETLDDLAERLRSRRVEAGSPSFGEIATRIGERRRRDGAGGELTTPARSTVYDCFREGRRRVDVALVLDVVAALGADRAELGIWRAWCAALQNESTRRPAVLTAFSGLPPLSAPFVAPAKALAQVRRANGTVVVVGMPGVGKTQLACAAIAAGIADGREQAAITVDVRGSDPAVSPADARAVVDAVARQLDMAAQESMPDDEWTTLIADELGRTRTAVLLDDVAGAEQFAALSLAMTTRLIATSRSASALSRAATLVELSPWGEDETIDLLRAHLDDDRLEHEADAARALAALTGGLPLAISILAGRIAHAEGWSLADHGARAQAGLGRLRVDDGVHLAFSQSYQALGVEQRRALRLLAAHPCSPLAVSFAEDLLDRSGAVTETLLRGLHDAHLITVGDRVWMHRLVRVFALARSWDEDPKSLRDAAVDRLVGAYLAALTTSDDDWIRQEVGRLTDLAAAIAPRRTDALVSMTAAVSDRLDAQGMFRSAEALQRLAYDCALRDGRDEAKTTTALALGRTLVRLGSSQAEAILTEALRWAERTGAALAASSAANSLAVIASMRGDLDGALQRFRESTDWAGRADRRDLQARLSDNIAIVLRRLGRMEEARTHHEKALEIAEELDDEAIAVTVLGNLSELLLVIGDAEAALDAASQALERGDGGGDFWRASALNNLGRALSASGQHELAVERQRQALDLAIETGAPVLISSVHNDMAATLAEAGDVEAARASLEAAHGIAREGGIVFEQARSLLGLAEQDAASGAHEAAARRARDALTLLDNTDGPEGRRARAVLRSVGATTPHADLS